MDSKAKDHQNDSAVFRQTISLKTEIIFSDDEPYDEPVAEGNYFNVFEYFTDTLLIVSTHKL